jgi:CubicO group peptidase (beta-lactamase class C family)
MLLTKIVEIVSHEPFAAFMQDRVFGPLGMSHSKINDDSKEIIPLRATGYVLRSDPRVVKELEQAGIAIHPGEGRAASFLRAIRTTRSESADLLCTDERRNSCDS